MRNVQKTASLFSQLLQNVNRYLEIAPRADNAAGGSLNREELQQRRRLAKQSLQYLGKYLEKDTAPYRETSTPGIFQFHPAFFPDNDDASIIYFGDCNPRNPQVAPNHR